MKALDILRVSPKNMPVQYSLCGVVAGIGGDMVKDYEVYRKYGCLRYPLLKVRRGMALSGLVEVGRVQATETRDGPDVHAGERAHSEVPDASLQAQQVGV